MPAAPPPVTMGGGSRSGRITVWDKPRKALVKPARKRESSRPARVLLRRFG